MNNVHPIFGALLKRVAPPPPPPHDEGAETIVISLDRLSTLQSQVAALRLANTRLAEALHPVADRGEISPAIIRGAREALAAWEVMS